MQQAAIQHSPKRLSPFITWILQKHQNSQNGAKFRELLLEIKNGKRNLSEIWQGAIQHSPNRLSTFITPILPLQKVCIDQTLHELKTKRRTINTNQWSSSSSSKLQLHSEQSSYNNITTQQITQDQSVDHSNSSVPPHETLICNAIRPPMAHHPPEFSIPQVYLKQAKSQT